MSVILHTQKEKVEDLVQGTYVDVENNYMIYKVSGRVLYIDGELLYGEPTYMDPLTMRYVRLTSSEIKNLPWGHGFKLERQSHYISCRFTDPVPYLNRGNVSMTRVIWFKEFDDQGVVPGFD